MTQLVAMKIQGRNALVPEKYAKLVQRKQDLVQRASQLKQGLESTTGIGNIIINQELTETMSKIISLNRKIPPCVKFV